MSPDLFPIQPFSIVPETGRTEPRLWIRRLAIWSDPDKPVVRDISLKKGLNIIWLPDPRSKDVGMGHGGGKTTLCRLFRYCLGEDSFASDTQRRRIADKLPKGFVGAEIMIEGRLWSVVRSLGFRKRDVVAEDRSIEDSLHLPPTGIEPLLDVITHVVLGDAAMLMPRDIGEAHAWEAALAWATRDQECRFGDHLRWRDPNTDSHSPIRQLAVGEILVVVRALVGAIKREEISSQELQESETKRATLANQESERHKWQLTRTRRLLVEKLGAVQALNSALEVEAFKAAASEKLAQALQVPLAHRITDPAMARKQYDDASREDRRLKADLDKTETVLDLRKRLLAKMLGEDQDLGNQLVTAKNPICPVCEVPIDQAMAEGCGVSKVKCDLQRVRDRVGRLKTEIATEQGSIKQLEDDASYLKKEIAKLGPRLTSLEQTVKTLNRAEREHSQAVLDARKTLYEVERYQSILSDLAATETSAGALSEQLEIIKSNLERLRESSSETIRHLSWLFSDVLGDLIPGDIDGEVKLDGRGLSLKVEYGGERSTAAIDSLKVVAFDLAILAMTIEGRTSMPGFLLHDSPREADLGLSIYHRIFDFARKLQSYGPAPLFQYIVTTTSAQ